MLTTKAFKSFHNNKRNINFSLALPTREGEKRDTLLNTLTKAMNKLGEDSSGKSSHYFFMLFEVPAELYSRFSYGINQHLFDFNGAMLVTSAEDLDSCVCGGRYSGRAEASVDLMHPLFGSTVVFLVTDYA